MEFGLSCKPRQVAGEQEHLQPPQRHSARPGVQQGEHGQEQSLPGCILLAAASPPGPAEGHEVLRSVMKTRMGRKTLGNHLDNLQRQAPRKRIGLAGKQSKHQARYRSRAFLPKRAPRNSASPGAGNAGSPHPAAAPRHRASPASRLSTSRLLRQHRRCRPTRRRRCHYAAGGCANYSVSLSAREDDN